MTQFDPIHPRGRTPSRRKRVRLGNPVPAVATGLLLLAGCGAAQGDERADGNQRAESEERRVEQEVERDEGTPVDAGTSLLLRLDETLHSERHGAGDPFTASVAEALGAEGRTLVPQGSKVHGSVRELSESPPRMRLAFHVLEVSGERHSLEAELVDITPREHSEMTDEAAKIGGGAAAGAVLGGVIGGNVKGAVIGAAAGAATGTGVALATKKSHVYLPAGSLLTLRLRKAIRVR